MAPVVIHTQILVLPQSEWELRPMKHMEAVTAAITESRLDERPAHAPLLELCRTLAGQMDAAGPDPSTRLTAAYLSALKDLRRATEALPPIRGESKLERMRSERSVPRPSKSTRRAG